MSDYSLKLLYFFQWPWCRSNANLSARSCLTRSTTTGTNRNWWGFAHRRWLLDCGRYVRSGEQRSARAGIPMGLRAIGEAGPELVGFRGEESNRSVP